MNSNLRALLTPDSATDHIKGSPSAKVTVVEYGDFECPACRQAYPTIRSILNEHRHDVRFVFRHFPLREVHLHAEMAAEASEAAGAQQDFWSFYDFVFSHQGQLDSKHFNEYALQAGLDMPRFQNELTEHVYLQRVQEQIRTGEAVGVRATPTFFVNGELVDVSFGLERLDAAVKAAFAS